MAEVDRWRSLCELVAQDDGLPTREVNHWSEDKLFFWNGYIDITTTAMVGKQAWSAGIVYVDLFAGPGVCTLKESRRRIPGSPLIAAHAPKQFARIIACEEDETLADACEKRLAVSPAAGRFKVIRGDCNAQINEVIRLIPDRALTLAFIDPTGLHARFDTIRRLASRGRVDLLILFADAYDIQRNVVHYYYNNSMSNLDAILGTDSDWRSKWDALENRSSTNVRKMFADIYKMQLQRQLGYRYFGEKIMCSAKNALYRLIYATKHPRGLEFWNKATTKYAGAGRQQRLF